MRLAGLAVLFTAVLAASAPAEAQPDAKDLAEANKHYQLAEKAAADKRWKDAAREYGIAYENSKDPVLFFKLASAYQAAGDCGSAKIYYKRYLSEAKPNERFKKLTEERLAECKDSGSDDAGSGANSGAGSGAGSGETGTTTGTGTGTTTGSDAGSGSDADSDSDADADSDSDSTLSPFGSEDDPVVPTDTTPTSDPSLSGEPSWQRTAGWISIGIAVALGTTGGVLGLAASSREDDIKAQIDFRDPTTNVPARFEGNAAELYNDRVDQGERFELLSLVSFAAAGAALGAAAVFFIIDPGPDSAEGSASIAPAIGPDTIGVSAGWSFDL